MSAVYAITPRILARKDRSVSSAKRKRAGAAGFELEARDEGPKFLSPLRQLGRLLIEFVHLGAHLLRRR